MAITRATIFNNGGAGTVSSFTTAAFTPVANRLYLLFVFNFVVAPVNTPTVTTTTGLTFVQIGTASKDNSSRSTVFRAMKSSGLVNGTVTIDCAGQVQDVLGFDLDEFSGVDTTGVDGAGAIVQSVTAVSATTASASVTATLAAFGSVNNGTYFSAVWNGGTAFTTFTPTAGFTDILNNAFAGFAIKEGEHSAWRANNSTDCTSTSNGPTGSAEIVAMELKATAAVGSAIPPPLFFLLGVGS